ncbi:hypothetical protein E2C01_070267 [Portunus trituberculatus]|uniref:Uncharacterized protein n=1 Tax=Portunus trituberculatus TaxID=210409 RepID=A0A5B7HTR0_PORTR|nr:hypothetical protein [Portunus trituberculatus]
MSAKVHISSGRINYCEEGWAGAERGVAGRVRTRWGGAGRGRERKELVGLGTLVVGKRGNVQIYGL